MVKKCIVKYDELGNPIALIEIKEFNDIKSFKDFENRCKENAYKELGRRINAEKQAAEEKKAAEEKIKGLENNVIFLIKAVKKILGVSTVEEVEAMIKEVNEHEEQKD